MKKLLLLTAILITITYSLLSQDRINPEKLFSSDTLTDIIVRNNNNFLIGLNWNNKNNSHLQNKQVLF